MASQTSAKKSKLLSQSVPSSSSSSSTSSSSSASSDTTSSQDSDTTLTTSSSSECNSEPEAEHQARKKSDKSANQAREGSAMRTPDSSHGEETDTNDAINGLVTSVSHVKRYKNSPFGLTHHYLTMPEVGLANGPMAKENLAPADEPEDYDSDLVLSSPVPRSSSASSKQKKRHQSAGMLGKSADGLVKTGSNEACDLSVIVGDSSSPVSINSDSKASGRWHDYKRHKSRHSSAMMSRQYKSCNFNKPAGDAGLDAPRCNAKDAAGQKCELGCACMDAEGDPASELGDASKVKPHLWVPTSRPGAVGQSSCESSGLLVRFSSIMYATFLVILGCILHVSELRQKSKNSSDHIYTTIVALIGIAWLVFLQTDLQRYKSYASKYILIESIFNDRKQLRDESNELARRQSMDPGARSTSSSSASLVNDRMSMNTEVIFKKTAHTMYQQRAALQRNQTGNNLFSNQGYQLNPAKHHLQRHHYDGPGSSILSVMSPSKIQHNPTPSLAAEFSQTDNLVPAYKFLHGKMGANFYLKCGMAAFCFGHVIHEGLRFGQQVYFFGAGNVHCRDSAAMIAHLVTPLYSFYQLFMMFKYSNLVINRNKVLARFGLMHIIGTSITFWIRTILEEAFEDFVHKMDYFKTQNKPAANNAASKTSDPDSSVANLINSISNALKSEASERSDKQISVMTDQNLTKAQSILTLMSSPLSATITPQMVKHLPESYACAQNTLLTTKSMNALPYLYPFTIEYNLLLAATFLSLYFNIGKIGSLGKEGPHVNCMPILNRPLNGDLLQRGALDSISSRTGSSDHLSSSHRAPSQYHQQIGEKETSAGEYKSNFVVNADCHSANKGLFCGFFVLLVTLVTIVIFFVTINKPTHIQLGIKINLIQEATLTGLILIVTLAGFKQVVKLNRNPYLKEKVTTDDVLMLIPLPFFFIHSLLSFRAETASMSSSNINSPNIDHFKLITVALNIIVMIEVLVQTNFIIDGMRRCSESRYLRFKKPGRELITFAILLNITYWIVATFETKSVEQYKTEIEYYGPLPYMFISHTTLPVMLFYRYHSSVCLAEIWNRAYKPPKKR